MIALTFVILIISLLAVTYVFFVMPRVSDGADMDLQSSDYAHGGLAYTNLPAASYGAFKDALTLGYGIECEPVLSKDQKLFLLPFGYSKKQIISMNSDRLTELGVVSLDQLLSLVDGQVPILFTLHPFVEKIDVLLFKKICATLDVYHGAFALQSPEPSILAFFKVFRPRYARGQMVLSKKNSSSAKSNRFFAFWRRHLVCNIISRPDFISTEFSLINEPAFLIATRLFRRRGFVLNVKNENQYSICRKRSLYSVFEHIRPQ